MSRKPSFQQYLLVSPLAYLKIHVMRVGSYQLVKLVQRIHPIALWTLEGYQ